MTTYYFKLVSGSDTHPQGTLVNSWQALFTNITQNTFQSIATRLDQQGLFLTGSCAFDGSTGLFHRLLGTFNNYGGWPVSYILDVDRKVGPYADSNSGLTTYGESRGSSLVMGNTAGFLLGTYPSSFSMAESGAAPYSFALGEGTQAYSKSDPEFTVPYGIYNCTGTWASASNKSYCSVKDTYTNSYSNTGTLGLQGTTTQSLPSYIANNGFCAAMDGLGTVAQFSDVNGQITLTTSSVGSDSEALKFVQAQYTSIVGGDMPSSMQGFMYVKVSQTYNDNLKITQGFDGVFDWSTLEQETLSNVTYAGLVVKSDMSTQALYTISTLPI